ncbi:alpha/beta fold hydrolase [uncultured Serinicoccus sp.]|uniref:alpha/beta fold hydrolase n=1 Tax=uncultured Serinicoccus sp. TaxID=735514 RepID=UPI00263472F8|nr:alpha/beta fold hydrolase [uncultured Serinicoccus sp.]
MSTEETLRHTRDGLTHEALVGGPPDGPVVLLLHGFPQDGTAWDRVSPALQEAGLRTLAPHQRGYAEGARPRRVAAYRLERLVEDALGLLDHVGVDRAHVVGHDWGGAVAWALAAWHPERVATLTVASTPHPRALAWAVRHADQARRSWYIAGFQVPVLPELVMARALRRGALVRTGLPAPDARRYAARLGTRAALRGPVGWYRAAARPGGRPVGRVEVPTTLVWGARDPFLGRAAAERTARAVSGPYRFVELDAGHWLPERRPAELAHEVLLRCGAAPDAVEGAG